MKVNVQIHVDNIFAGLQSWQSTVVLSLFQLREVSPSIWGRNKPLYGIPTAGIVVL